MDDSIISFICFICSRKGWNLNSSFFYGKKFKKSFLSLKNVLYLYRTKTYKIMTTKELVVTTLAQTKVETNTIFEFMIRFAWGKVEVCRFHNYEKMKSTHSAKPEDLLMNVIKHAGSSLGCCDFEGYIIAGTISDFHDKALMIINSALHQYELKTFKEQKQFDDALKSIEHMKG